MYELVGDKVQEIFDAQAVDIGVFDFEAGVTRFPYSIERGVRMPGEPAPISYWNRRLIESRQAIRVDDFERWMAENPDAAVVIVGEPPDPVLIAPMTVGGDVRGRISLQNLDHHRCLLEADERLLGTSPPASAWRSRTPACSTRRSAS